MEVDVQNEDVDLQQSQSESEEKEEKEPTTHTEEQPPASEKPPTIEQRLIITHIENINFKSYAGKQVLGPFHKVLYILHTRLMMYQICFKQIALLYLEQVKRQ